MHSLRESVRNSSRSSVAGFFAGVFLLFLIIASSLTTAQQKPGDQTSKMASANSAQVARGKYIVQGVAACGQCHTPRKANGELDTSRWLAGAPVPYLSAHPEPNWPINAPRLGGAPPTSDAGMITLLTTGIWIDGKPLRLPMPEFHMTKEDAEAVVAYLKTVNPRSPN